MFDLKSFLKEFDQDHMSYKTVARIATRHGFRKIGYGVFSLTYGRCDLPYVVKVNRRTDPAAFKFYSTVISKPSKYLPKVHKLKSYVDQEGDFLFVAVMEKLYPLNKRSVKNANKDATGFVRWLATHPDSFIEVVCVGEEDDMAEAWRLRNKEQAKMIIDVIASIKKFGGVDFHDQNIMLRLPKGDIVLTDPVCTY
jgi:hypothetical protein